ncbi:chloride channel CLIC-like protein 1 isoform X2 [Stigmatopora argus]
MRFIVLFGYLTLVSSQQLDDDWLDPYDLLNYDASTKTMRKPAETAKHVDVPKPRGEHIDSGQVELTDCNQQLSDLQTQIEAQKKTVKRISEQPTCNPVFKRFLSRLLKDMLQVETPKDTIDYDATIRLSGHELAEIQNFLGGEDGCRSGALDNAISQVLVNVRPHDHGAWMWHFEDTFGIELDTLLKLASFILILVAIICTQLWSCISWFVQFKRMFSICFIVSIAWNWFYLYKIAFAEHQNNIVKMDKNYEKCTGVKTMDWRDSLKEWFRSTWTLQDDPCKRYYENLMVDPILLVSPTKAISVTITTLFTEPLKHIGLGISDFLRALLQDLPITLQIPVLLTIVLAIMVFMYGTVQAVFRYGITAPLYRHRRDPILPPPEQRYIQEIENRGYIGGDDTPQHCTHFSRDEARPESNQSCRSRLNAVRKEPARIVVETLRTAVSSHSQPELDGKRRARRFQAGQGDEPDPRTDSESDEHTEVEETQRGASAVAPQLGAKTKTKPADCDSSLSEPPKDTTRERTPSRLPQSQRKEDVQDQNASGGDSTRSVSMPNVETLQSPVQETLQSTL